jgi:hypothetical protein
MRRTIWTVALFVVAAWVFFASTGRTWQLQRLGAVLLSEVVMLRERIGL